MSENNSIPDYQKYMGEKIWTLREAFFLFFGVDPATTDYFVARDKMPDVAKKFFSPTPWNERGELEPLLLKAERAILAGNLKIKGENSRKQPFFEPHVIVKWLSELMGLEPAPELSNLLPTKKVCIQPSKTPDDAAVDQIIEKIIKDCEENSHILNAETFRERVNAALLKRNLGEEVTKPWAENKWYDESFKKRTQAIRRSRGKRGRTRRKNPSK